MPNLAQLALANPSAAATVAAASGLRAPTGSGFTGTGPSQFQAATGIPSTGDPLGRLVGPEERDAADPFGTLGSALSGVGAPAGAGGAQTAGLPVPGLPPAPPVSQLGGSLIPAIQNAVASLISASQPVRPQATLGQLIGGI